MIKKYYNSDNIGLVPLKAIILTGTMIALITNIPVFAFADAILGFIQQILNRTVSLMETGLPSGGNG
jgi:hypothetical protein